MSIPAERPFEPIQRLVARLVATSPAGEGLRLIGGLRYRLLDGSCRSSLDVDYHCEGDLDGKRDEILALLERKLFPDLKRRLGLEGTAGPLVGPDAGAISVRTIDLAVFTPGVPGSRFELPVDVTHIACLDPPSVRTAGGTVYLTASDADMVESKVIAILDRVFVQARDLLDLFLFQAALPPDRGDRVRRKLATLSIPPAVVEEQLRKLRENAAAHARAVDRVIREQVDPPAAANLMAAGGGQTICQAALALVEGLVRMSPGS